MLHCIDNGILQVQIDAFGAQIKSVKYHGKERAWQNENGAWKDTAPLLFPVCGHFGMTVAGKTYDMPAHGFVKKTPFIPEEISASAITFVCKANEQTKSVYPFDFTFKVTYELIESTLKIAYTVKNDGKAPLPFACGGHDSFALENDVDGYQIAFENRETLIHCSHDDDGFLTGEKVCYGENIPALKLPKEYLAEGRTLIFKDLQSRKAQLQTMDGKTLATLTFDGFANLLIWRATADSKYICIEPWTNLPDLAGSAPQEIYDKAGVYVVPQGEEKTLVREITYAND